MQNQWSSRLCIYNVFPWNKIKWRRLARVGFDCGTLVKKDNQIFLKYKEIQNGSGAKSYVTNGLLTYGEIFAHFLIC